ncbi:prenyltransferase [Streptomyces sp. RY43-2]|uniref:Prenyltransferase n=1 Tax=Streptomyces macrolidinus TaxID=2952607 RepID=A0ABT0Z9U2_9ACTN|nr:tryptophan dimethylallyltransferase family protein [Streptomyces macrolidinus]MCN9240534.1 prenyltransferase [Streptomyces macrolidinus]
MIASRSVGRKTPGVKELGGFAADQLLRLCEIAGLDRADAETYAQVLIDALGPVAERSLALPPPSRSFLSDDHTPVEYSLSFTPGAAPALRVLLEPGCDAESLAENGRIGLSVIRQMAKNWGFATDKLDLLEDLFFPPSPQGLLAVWCALELRPGGVPKLKVYLNPSARGADRAAETVREALERLGHRQAFDALPPADGYPFLALDLGDWEAPRVKVYVMHHSLSATEAGALARRNPGFDHEAAEWFFRNAAGYDDATAEDDTRLAGKPALTCHSFTRTTSGEPTGFTLHIPVRDYVRHDGEAHTRSVSALRRHGMDEAALARSMAAVTARSPQDGRGLIAYLALAQEHGRAPRVTTYISSEAYEVPPPAVLPSPRQVPAEEQADPGRQTSVPQQNTQKQERGAAWSRTA